MDANRQQQMYRRLAGDNDFQTWLKEEEKRELSHLVQQVDIVQIHKTQGRVQVIQKLLTQSEATRNQPA